MHCAEETISTRETQHTWINKQWPECLKQWLMSHAAYPQFEVVQWSSKHSRCKGTVDMNPKFKPALLLDAGPYDWDPEDLCGRQISRRAGERLLMLQLKMMLLSAYWLVLAFLTTTERAILLKHSKNTYFRHIQASYRNWFAKRSLWCLIWIIIFWWKKQADWSQSAAKARRCTIRCATSHISPCWKSESGPCSSWHILSWPLSFPDKWQQSGRKRCRQRVWKQTNSLMSL